MTIFYKLYDKLYVNITNSCPCSCVFCIRQEGEGVGGSDSLWLEREPKLDEIKADFDARDLSGFTEIVFCGYGEPLERADIVIETCQYIKSKSSLPIRINTNGLVGLINPGFDISRLSIADTVSVSLNADDEEEYIRVSRPRFGAGSFKSLLEFAKALKDRTNVVFTLVDVIDQKRIDNCKKLSADMGIPLRVREYIKEYEV